MERAFGSKLVANFSSQNEGGFARNLQLAEFYGVIGGPDLDRTDDLFHAMEMSKS
ncbi:hypothetical protein [Tunturibacter empetritectus]|uniref:Uncharacterized protein n=1 Tax=Tunturiibacter empetritectus TaxID=3069691 RepID=A0A7W8IMP2_9BACT|nr:hypothetical protein [Edaphobacter lichenicola]MBB5319305.1 hypothetical protein [Edaphobacter lichenicola]